MVGGAPRLSGGGGGESGYGRHPPRPNPGPPWELPHPTRPQLAPVPVAALHPRACVCLVNIHARVWATCTHATEDGPRTPCQPGSAHSQTAAMVKVPPPAPLPMSTIRFAMAAAPPLASMPADTPKEPAIMRYTSWGQEGAQGGKSRSGVHLFSVGRSRGAPSSGCPVLPILASLCPAQRSPSGSTCALARGSCSPSAA